MMQQALDEQQLKQQHQPQQQLPAAAAGETTSLSAGAADANADAGTSGDHHHHHPPPPRYGATSETDEQEESQLQSSFEGDYLLDSDWQEEEDDDDDDDDDENETPAGISSKICACIKNAFVVVANVENLWDSPDSSLAGDDVCDDDRGGHEHHHQQHQPLLFPALGNADRRQRRRRNQMVVLFWFFVLATSYTTERSSFKLLVDRAGPFRLFAVEMVTATHAILLGTIMFISHCLGHRQQVQSLGVPLVDVGLMALLDTVAILLVFITGLRVPPTLTVILVQFILPLTAFLTQFVHPDGRCTCRHHPPPGTAGATATTSTTQEEDQPQQNENRRENGQHANRANENQVVIVVESTDAHPLPGYGGLSREHVWGSLIIFLAVLLALTPASYALADPDFFDYADAIPIRTAINTMLYASSCIPAAASQLYKEHIFTQFKQPVNMDYLNLLLSIFQFTFASIMAPLVFVLQGVGARGDWTELYPSTNFSENFIDGLQCFFGLLSDEDQENKYPEDARCQLTLVLVLFHALAIILVGVAVDKIVNAGATKVMYRGISAGIIASVLCMYVYDMKTPDFNYGPLVDALNLLCLIILILGSEVYHRVSLQDSTFETVYPQVENFFDA